MTKITNFAEFDNGKNGYKRNENKTHYAFGEEAKPLFELLEEWLEWAERIEGDIPDYLLDNIDRLSEGITNLEAVFGTLVDKCTYLENKSKILERKWKNTTCVTVILKNALHGEKLSPEKNWDIFSKIKRVGA